MKGHQQSTALEPAQNISSDIAIFSFYFYKHIYVRQIKCEL